MKKLVIIAFLAFFLAGCSQTAMQSETVYHDSLYKNFDHLKFSWFGHRTPTAEDRQLSMEQGWWGVEVPYVPGQ